MHSGSLSPVGVSCGENETTNCNAAMTPFVHIEKTPGVVGGEGGEVGGGMGPPELMRLEDWVQECGQYDNRSWLRVWIY